MWFFEVQKVMKPIPTWFYLWPVNQHPPLAYPIKDKGLVTANSIL